MTKACAPSVSPLPAAAAQGSEPAPTTLTGVSLPQGPIWLTVRVTDQQTQRALRKKAFPQLKHRFLQTAEETSLPTEYKEISNETRRAHRAASHRSTNTV